MAPHSWAMACILLDACTSYGTLLLWPFSYHRIAWDIIAIVDPIFSLALLVGVLWAVVGRRPWPARLAVCCAAMYLGFGIWQSHRATAVQDQVAVARGHAIEHRRVMPLPGSLVSWRAVYCGRPNLCRWRTSPWWNSPLVKPGGATSLATFDHVPRPWLSGTVASSVRGLCLVCRRADCPRRRRGLDDRRHAVCRRSQQYNASVGYAVQCAPVDGPTRWRPPNSSRTRILTNIWRSLIDHDSGYRPVHDVLNDRPG